GGSGEGRPGWFRLGWHKTNWYVLPSGIWEGNRRWSRVQIGCGLAAAAVILLVESLVGHAGTVVVFALLVAIGVSGRVGHPLLLVAAAVVLSAETFILHAVGASRSSRGMIVPVWVAVWGLEGLLINALLVEALAAAPGTGDSDQTLEMTRRAIRT